MLLRCVRAEMMKIKNSFIWTAFLILPVLSTGMGCMNYLNNLEVLNSRWYSLWTQTTLFYSNFFCAPMIALYCSYLWRVENFNHNRNSLMCAPVPTSCLYGAQFLTTACLTLLMQLWVGILYVAGGLLTGLTGLPPADTALWLLRGWVGSLAVISLQLLVSTLIRSFALPIALALLGGVAGLLMVSHNLGLFWPYSLMLLGMNSNREEDMLGGSPVPFLISCLLFAALFFWLGVGHLRRTDVRA